VFRVFRGYPSPITAPSFLIRVIRGCQSPRGISTMTPAEVELKLDELLELPAETEWAEFKEAKNGFHFNDLGQYFSALSNEANLKNQTFGWLVFGV
jgi:hypothetical protein